MTKVKPMIICIVAVVLCGLAAIAEAGPLVDGKFDPTEGYNQSFLVNLTVEADKKSTVAADDGVLWLFQDDVDNSLYVNLTLPLTLVDNTYGKNSIGWGKNVAISGESHSFGDLKGSDKAQFLIYDGEDNLVLDFTLDYMNYSKSITGDILEAGTSLDYNFNTLGYKLDKNSPETDENYTEDAKYAGWLFEVSYEFKIDGKVLGDNGLGGIAVPMMHVSPNKIAKNKVFGEVTTGDQIPEPASLILLSLGAIGLLPKKRR